MCFELENDGNVFASDSESQYSVSNTEDVCIVFM